MIVVTLLAVPLGYVGWQAKIVRERKAWLDAHPQPPFFEFIRMPAVVAGGDRNLSPSHIRVWLGDNSHDCIGVDFSSSIAERREAANLFPEAEVYVSDLAGWNEIRRE
jgi:hypothetical protein